VAELNFGNGTWEDARGLLEQLAKDHNQAIFGNGKEGMLLTLEKFIGEYRTTEQQRAEAERKRAEDIKQALVDRERKVNLRIALGTAVIGIPVGVHELIEVLKLFKVLP
jgi:hypothetical protein